MKANVCVSSSSADVVYVHLQFSVKISLKYQKACKKILKIFLLNRTVFVSEKLQVNPYLTALVVSAKRRKHNLFNLLQYLVSPSTKILYVTEFESYPNQDQVLSSFQSRIIATGLFSSSVLKEVSFGLKRKEISLCLSAGILIQSGIGGGKSTLLRALYEAYGESRSHYLNCRELIGKSK
jgi:hypothetical protein